jgi:hypothetical protein
MVDPVVEAAGLGRVVLGLAHGQTISNSRR